MPLPTPKPDLSKPRAIDRRDDIRAHGSGAIKVQRAVLEPQRLGNSGGEDTGGVGSVLRKELDVLDWWGVGVDGMEGEREGARGVGAEDLLGYETVFVGDDDGAWAEVEAAEGGPGGGEGRGCYGGGRGEGGGEEG